MAHLTLLLALVLVAAWFGFTFVRPAGLGIVHLLLAAGVVLLMRWWVVQSGPQDGRAGGREGGSP